MAENKPVEIVVVKNNPIDDLSTLMLNLYVSFKFSNPELFFAKLGDIMTSNSSIDISVLKAKFINLVASSAGTLHKVGNITPEELNSNIVQPRISIVDMSDIKEIADSPSNMLETNVETNVEITSAESTTAKTETNLTRARTTETIENLGSDYIPTAGQKITQKNTNVKNGTAPFQFGMDGARTFKSGDTAPVDPSEIFAISETGRKINKPILNLSSTPVPTYNKQGDDTAGIAIKNLAKDIYLQASSKGVSNRIDVFLYNVIPYLTSGFISSLSGTVKSIKATGNDFVDIYNTFGNSENTKDFKTTLSTLGGAINKLGSVLSFGQGFVGVGDVLSGVAKYFSWDELAWMLVADFYSIFYNRGIKIKDLINMSAPFSSGLSINSLTQELIVRNGKISSARGTTGVINPKDETALLPFLVDLSAELVLHGMDSSFFIKRSIGNRVNEIPGPILNDYSENIIPVEIESGTSLEDKMKSSREYNAVYDGREFDKDNVASLKGVLRDKYGTYQIGSVCIFPLNSDEPGFAFAPTRIPFEFNPLIAEGDVQARYASQQILSRIGDLFSFTGVSAQVITVTAAYQALAAAGEPDNILNMFSMDNIVAIENSYRSLVLPYFPKSTGVASEEGQQYVRPPYIKIIMGNTELVNDNDVNDDTAYSTLLRYPKSIENSVITRFKTYKTFIATSVKITRTEESPFLVENIPPYGYVLKNYMGFSVDLSLTEVSPGYAEALPTFLDYYSKGIRLGV